MARPKGYDRDTVLVAARDLFWKRGYERVSIADLEQQTGLNRSSIYAEFGSKHELFIAALDCYADRVIADLLAGLRDDSRPGIDSIFALFQQLSVLFGHDTVVSTQGCMMVNAIAELAAHDPAVRAQAQAYRDRLRASFGAALSRAVRHGEIDSGTGADTVEARARLLATTLIGIWLSVRIDPADASTLCRAVAQQVRAWRTL